MNSIPGSVVPLAMFPFWSVHFLSSIHPSQARLTTVFVYNNAMLHAIIFRAFFILLPDYGLVKDGRPDLRLVHQLYWLALTSFVLVSHSILPLSFLIKGIFPEGTGPGRVCLIGLAMEQNQETAKFTIMQFMDPLLVAIANSYACWRVRRFLRGHCPRGRMSCIGDYRRNVITLKETSNLLHILCFSALIDSVMMAVFPDLDKILEGKVLFWIWNIKGILFNEGLFLTIPLFLDIPLETEVTEGKTVFYVSAPSLPLIPRQPTRPTLTSYSSAPSSSSSVVVLPNEPSTSFKINGAEERYHARSKQTGLILFVRSASPLSTSPSPSPTPPPPTKPRLFSGRKCVSKAGKTSKKIKSSIPAHQPHNALGKKYRTTFYCKWHQQVERVESQP